MLPISLVTGSIASGVVATGALLWINEGGNGGVSSVASRKSSFAAFQRTYLGVYLSAMMADWLQGPFVYALYDSYGWSRSDNAMFFVAGYGSSALFGTFIGALADKFGRRSFAMLYCLLYGVSCLTKHFSAFSMLFLGRVVGGISTSLLNSVFESWLVSEHISRGFDPDALGSTFGVAIFGNSLVAIVAGGVGQVVVDMWPQTQVLPGVFYGGLCSPFDAAIVCLLACSVLMVITWSENFGQNKLDDNGESSLQRAIRIVLESPLVLCCGLVSSTFEASMFIFVFNWTPLLMEEGQPKPPFGYIFSAFMIMCMLGSRIFSLLTQSMPLENVGRLTLIMAAVCHLVPIFFSDVKLRFLGFLVFEMCVGMYFPMICTLKGKVVPEESRAAIYNLFRLPLNAIVVAVMVLQFEARTSFALTSTLLLCAAVAQTQVIALRQKGYAAAQPKSTNGNGAKCVSPQEMATVCDKKAR